MENQSNKIMMLEWLLPLLNQHLLQVSDGWQQTAPNYAQLIQDYQQINSTFILVNMPRLGYLAFDLGQLAAVGEEQGLEPNQKRFGQFTQQLLVDELHYRIQTGSYRYILLKRTSAELMRVLPVENQPVEVEQFMQSRIADTDNQHNSASSFDDLSSFSDFLNIDYPSCPSSMSLQQQQYQQLLLVWRQQLQQLFDINSNQAAILQSLKKVSRYLWQAEYASLINTQVLAEKTIGMQQHLWFLADLWLTNLINNQQPLPAHYAQILSGLERALEAKINQTEAVDLSSTSQAEIDNTKSTIISNETLESLLVDIYIQLNTLANIVSDTQNILSQSMQASEVTERFLPWALGELETIIFDLDQPQKVLVPLQHLKTQLGRRGWTAYEAQVNQILIDLKDSKASEAAFVQMQWKIELQLQELYSAIYHFEQDIDTNIGSNISHNFYDLPSATFATSDQQQVATDDNDKVLAPLCNAVISIEHNFTEYTQYELIDLLPSVEKFVEISKILSEMGLTEVAQVSDNISELFIQIVANEVETISDELTETIAASIAVFECLLASLAWQVADHHLIQQANDYVEQAHQLLLARIANPDAEISVVDQKIATDVVRYDDSGEIAATDDKSVVKVVEEDTDNQDYQLTSSERVGDDAIEYDSVVHEAIESEDTENEALQLAHKQVETDDIQTDDTIRNVFIKDATESVGDLADFLPIWEQDPQDLTALTEVKRNFCVLKEFGQIAGASSAKYLGSNV